MTDRAVQWQRTDESWREIVALYAGLETVALWPPEGPLTVETAKGRGAAQMVGGQERERRDPDSSRRPLSVSVIECGSGAGDSCTHSRSAA